MRFLVLFFALIIILAYADHVSKNVGGEDTIGEYEIRQRCVKSHSEWERVRVSQGVVPIYGYDSVYYCDQWEQYRHYNLKKIKKEDHQRLNP